MAKFGGYRSPKGIQMPKMRSGMAKKPGKIMEPNNSSEQTIPFKKGGMVKRKK